MFLKYKAIKGKAINQSINSKLLEGYRRLSITLLLPVSSKLGLGSSC